MYGVEPKDGPGPMALSDIQGRALPGDGVLSMLPERLVGIVCWKSDMPYSEVEEFKHRARYLEERKNTSMITTQVS